MSSPCDSGAPRDEPEPVRVQRLCGRARASEEDHSTEAPGSGSTARRLALSIDRLRLGICIFACDGDG
jgi:hypothetical protein